MARLRGVKDGLMRVHTGRVCKQEPRETWPATEHGESLMFRVKAMWSAACGGVVESSPFGVE